MGMLRTSRSIQGLVLTVVVGGGLALAAQSGHAGPEPYTTWQYANGAPDSSNYSALTQIDRSNVANLQVAWTYDTQDQVGYTFQPLVAGRVMYALAKNGSLVAVDATNGKEIWVHPFPGSNGLRVYRGLNYWENAARTDQRLFIRVDGNLEAIDAKTGKLVPTFGSNGRVDLRTGMTRGTKPDNSKSPGQVFENLLILGSATGEAYGSPPADIRAFDVVTGSLAWVFHTIPHPGEYGYETWPKDAWTYSGGAAAWGELSIDQARGIAYIPVGTPKYEFWGGDRHGDTLFSNTLLALDARTGKRIWHYQMIHHDVWEYEPVAAPQLLTVRQNGKPVDIVAQASKNGFLYVLNRVTGQPIWPIPERPVPPSDVPGEKLSPTQPFPTKPPSFVRQSYTVKDIDKIILNDADRATWTEMVSKARNDGLYTPISLDYWTVMMPGHSGGAIHFTTSSDLATGTMYVIGYDQPSIQRYFRTAAEAAQHVNRNLWSPPVLNGNPVDGVQILPDRRRAPIAPTGTSQPPAPLPAAAIEPPPYPDGADVPPRMYTNYSASPLHVTPPYSNITAYDLNNGTIKWQIPYGEAVGVNPPGNNFGIVKVHGPKARLAITAGGLAFSATVERKARAFDKDTGKVLWSAALPDGAEGAPAVYEVDGRQYVVFCTRGAYIAYALPAKS